MDSAFYQISFDLLEVLAVISMLYLCLDVVDSCAECRLQCT